MAAALWALVVLAVLFVTGAPIAQALARRRRLEWTQFVFEACSIGLLAQVAIAVVAMRSGHFTRLTLVCATLLVVGAGLAAGGWRIVRDPPTFDARWLLGVAVLVVAALALRTHVSYFLFQTGDMGEYVNQANLVARGFELLQSFPHGFTMFLAGTNLLLGRAHTVAGLPALGVLLLLGTVSVARALGLRTVAALVAGAIVVVLPVTVWFSTFPVSEVLYASLLMPAVYFLVCARREQSRAYGILSGLLLGMLLMVRGTALLFVPIVIAVVFVSAAGDDDAEYRVQRAFTIAALCALFVAYAYEIRYVSRYFVLIQLHEFVPNLVYRAARKMHLLQWSWELVVVAAVGIVAVVVSAQLLRALVVDRLRPHVIGFFQVCAAVVVAGGLVVCIAIRSGGLVDALARWGPAALLLVGAGMVLVVARPTRYLDGTTTVFVLLGIVVYAILYAARIPTPRTAPYYLYWDRYLFSEVLPLALVLLAIGLHAIAELYSVRIRTIAIAFAVLIVLLLGPALTATRKIERYTFFGNAYGTFARLDKLTLANGVAWPVVYSGLQTMPPGWFSPETYRAFAMPLSQTFHRRLIGVTFDPYHKDPLYDPISARTALAQKHFNRGFLVALRASGAEPFPDDAHTRFVGMVDYRVPVIARQLDSAHEHYRVVPFEFDVYALTDSDH
jgi:hypothetical protein